MGKLEVEGLIEAWETDGTPRRLVTTVKLQSSPTQDLVEVPPPSSSHPLVSTNSRSVSPESGDEIINPTDENNFSASSSSIPTHPHIPQASRNFDRRPDSPPLVPIPIPLESEIPSSSSEKIIQSQGRRKSICVPIPEQDQEQEQERERERDQEKVSRTVRKEGGITKQREKEGEVEAGCCKCLIM